MRSVSLHLVSASRGRVLSLDVGRPLAVALALVLLLALVSASAGGGYLLARHLQSEPVQLAHWREEMHEQKVAVDEIRRRTQADVAALTSRLGLMQAHVTRLDALGQKLVKMAELDADEFDFSNEPALGGPEVLAELPSPDLPDLTRVLDDLAREISEREHKLAVLEDLVMARRLNEEVFPEGRPITKGWISSYYGMRNHPISGKREMHKGMDFAGKAGSEVVAVAGGLVTYSGDRYGYGTMVEIDHGNGYKTRYGHNKENLVKVGDTVRKGELIARMGSTGRSTGPHVHFEVLKDGRPVNPYKFIRTARK